MTKTFTTVVSDRFERPDLPMIMMLGITVDGSFILNLGHWNLFEIWFLELEIFMIFIKQVILIRHKVVS